MTFEEGTIEYFKNNIDHVVVEKRAYIYIFRNNGQIPTFSTEKNLDTPLPGEATYLFRLPK